MINQRRVVWFEGPKGVGKTTTINKFYEELKEIGLDVKIFDLSITTNHSNYLDQISHRLNEYKQFVKYFKGHLITLVDESLIKTLVNIYLEPYKIETTDIEIQKLFEYEAHLIPDELIPTHIVFFKNPTYTKNQESWDNYKKEVQAYEEIFKKEFFIKALRPLNVKKITINFQNLDDRINPLFDAIKK